MKKEVSFSYVLLLLSIWALGITITLWRCLALCDGHLIYTLDDPYIHLSVAENILKGSYGVNLGESSSPCSSIMYPFILAGTEWIKLGVVGPLIINLLAMGGAVFMLGKIIEKNIFPLVNEVKKYSKHFIFYLVIGMLLCFIMNAWGLVFTGMEHSIHVLLCLVIFYNFIQLVEINKAPTLFLYLALILLPFIRFEGLALSILGIIFLYHLGHKKPALVSLLSVGLLMVTWGCFMYDKGLPFFPSSVQMKSKIVSSVDIGINSGIFYTIFKNFLSSFLNSWAAKVFCVSLLILTWLIYKEFKNAKRSLIYLSLVILFTGMAHAILGRYGWFARYEIYAAILIWLTILVLLRNTIPKIYITIVSALIIVAIGHSTLGATYSSPAASKNIYEQQYQMHRFTVDFWKGPVAVNDLGWVSYRNDSYVLDLYGLGSEDVRLAKKLGTYDANKINEFQTKNNIGLIMIYDKWFEGKVPRGWIKIATLKTSKVTAAYDSVQFYLTNKSDILEAKKLLIDFSVDLPSGSKIIIQP